jgi:hypothetical protein
MRISRSTPAPAPREERVPMGLHAGKAMLKLARTYPSAVRMILEFIQNSIDSEAENIWVRVDFRSSRTITVRDDGDGSTPARLNHALSAIASTIKPSGKLGRWGLGFISFLDKCGECFYTSTPRASSSAFNEWHFDCPRIAEQASDISIGMRACPDLVYSRAKAGKQSGKEYVNWRSEIRVLRFHKDPVLSKINVEQLTESIQDRFSDPMRKLKTVVHVVIINEDGRKEEAQITAKAFTGRRLQEFTATDRDAGMTFFSLYLSPRSKGHKGKVVVGELGDAYRFEFAKFVKNCPNEYLPTEAVEALQSGIFEGEILSTNARLHPGREAFEVDEALVGFCATLQDWFDKVGKHHVLDVKEAHRDKVNQERGLLSLRVVAKMLEDPRFASLAEVVKSFGVGTIGEGHTPVEAKKVGETKALSITAGQPQLLSGSGTDRDRSAPEREKEGHQPFTVAGPRGKTRTLVRDNSVGLQFAYDGVTNSKRVWELDEKRGVLLLNTYHWLWGMAERGGDKTVMRFQEYIAIQALQLAAMGETESRWHSETAFESLLESFLFLLLNGDAIAGRLPGKRTGAVKQIVRND